MALLGYLNSDVRVGGVITKKGSDRNESIAFKPSCYYITRMEIL